MKKLAAIVIAVLLVTSLSGIAMAENFKTTGNGALSGPHYNLNIIGMDNPKSADMTGTSGHTIFVPLKGRAKIELYPSTSVDLDDDGIPDIVADERCTKDFLVLDRNAFDDPAQFCLPVPEVEGDTVSYTVFARALGGPGGQSFTTTCAYDTATDELWCSSITMHLERPKGKSQFIDVSKYLLFIYIDGQRYSLFDPALYGYFWKYDNDGLKLAQLRFYQTPTTVPTPGEVPEVTATDPSPLELPKCQTTTVTLYGNSYTDLTYVTRDDVTIFTPTGKGKGINILSADGSAGSNLVLQIQVTDQAAISDPFDPEGANTIYVDLKDEFGNVVDMVNVDFTVVAGICLP